MESPLEPALIDLTKDPSSFFALLPEDWRNDIYPEWPNYENNSKIFGVKLEHEIVGGGIVFGKISPDTQAYALEAQKLFEAGMHYFGFLWIDPVHRGKELGSYWIGEVKKKIQKPLWLSIEEKGLQPFYERNGFKIYKTVHVDEITEWMMISKESDLF